MDTPILDFVRHYADTDMIRFHMPGHKGHARLGCEKWDITEVKGADALYEADGIIAKSEKNATSLFGSMRTVYSTEGSSQCIRAMLYLAVTNQKSKAAPVIVAARNVHKAFLYAAALLDIEVEWLWPGEHDSLCSCPVSPVQLEQTLAQLDAPPAAVYLTSPDYLGGVADIAVLADICHKYNTLLIVDNAHGAYLRFLHPSQHPLDLGADMCCDSAHKTLPVFTGGAYLHISKNAPGELASQAKSAMALFGSTSPSYLTLASLDHCNAELAGEYSAQLSKTTKKVELIKQKLTAAGWQIRKSDPLRVTITAPCKTTGTKLAQMLRNNRIECEYADDMFLVLMLTPDNDQTQMEYLTEVLGKNHASQRMPQELPLAKGRQAVSIRQAFFSPYESIPVKDALGRICASPAVSCPPAIPIAVSGEVIGEEAITLFNYYGIEMVDVLKQ